MSRPYSMSRRREQTAATRERIVRAAVELYRSHGIPNVSMSLVARRAGVSPATVLNHFATAEALADAGIRHILEGLHVPGPEILEGAASPAERVRRFVAAMFAFYDRSTGWFEATRHDLPTLPVLQSASAEFEHAISQLLRAALGPGFSDPAAAATVAGLTGPGTLGSLRAAGLSAAEAADVVGSLLAPLVDGASRED